MSDRTQNPFIEELPHLLAERGLTVSAVAKAVGVSRQHLSRVLRERNYKTPSGELTRRVAEALDLPPDYFPEYRAAAVTTRIAHDPKYRDTLYDALKADEAHRSS